MNHPGINVQQMPLPQFLEELCGGLTIDDLPKPNTGSPVTGEFGAICRQLGIAERVGVPPQAPRVQAVLFGDTSGKPTPPSRRERVADWWRTHF